MALKYIAGYIQKRPSSHPMQGLGTALSDRDVDSVQAALEQ